ncbi:MAG: bifunctional phosphoribosylaminoimidazolecarboxamide formyltransferase/IMP cyclohydrolase PurH [Planctomycetota bacterium]|nr:MAG: bifunctional phosphoribosylaminoimidazolecarboxamide formyltransferase/IMP cyclohydrolase PurH [Planctomycetota bacterium]
MSNHPIRRALLSVFYKDGIVELAQDLHRRGVELLSTGGTYVALQQAGLPVIEVAEYTGFPEMMDGRVKTLHPKIHGGLLAVRDDTAHMSQAQSHDIGMIDCVVVNLYPFEATCDDPQSSAADRIEKIDIGGPSMLRSAAKNHASVTVITDPEDYAALRHELEEHDGATSLAFRRRCARAVFRITSRYDALIAEELLAQEDNETQASERYPSEMALPLRKIDELRYGENPHQSAAFYSMRLPGSCGLASAQQLHGKALSYNNIMDADAAWELVREFQQTACAVIKHTNPCGCAVASSQVEAFVRAWEGDPQAAFGSIIAFNQPMDAATAEALAEPGRFVEAIVAPSFSDEAISILTTKPRWKANVRLLAAGDPQPIPGRARYCKNILGGLLIQDVDHRGWEPNALSVVTQRSPSMDELADLELAWPIVKHLKSNAICLVKDGCLVGAGAGQMSRVASVRIAVEQAGERAQGAVLASDAFFPFPDGLQVAIEAGVRAVIQPGGSKGDPAVIAAADEAQVAMVCTGVRHFRH